jgi:hypothetical protein
LGFGGERLSDFALLLEGIKLRMKPPMEGPLPRGSISVESDETEREESGLFLSSMALEIEEMVELRFKAKGVASVGVLGGTMPSKDRNVPGEASCGSVRMIRSLRLGAGLQGLVGGDWVSCTRDCSRKNKYCE